MMDPRLVVAAGVVFTSFSAILIRFSDAPPLIIAFYRMAIVTVLTIPFSVAEKPRVRATRRDIALSAAAGLLLAGHFAAWITSLSHTSVAAATVLVTTHPILVAAIGALLFKESLRPRSLAFMGIALAGGVVLAVAGGEGGPTGLFGNLLAVIGSVTFALYMIIGRYVRRRLGVAGYTLAVYGVAALVLAIAVAAAGLPLTGYPPVEYLLFAALAVVCTLLGHTLFSWALRHLKTSLVSTSILGEPVIAAALAALLFGELPSIVTLVSGLAILTGIYLFVRSEARGHS